MCRHCCVDCSPPAPLVKATVKTLPPRWWRPLSRPSWKNPGHWQCCWGHGGSTRVRMGSPPPSRPRQSRVGGGLLPPRYSWSSNPDSWPEHPASPEPSWSSSCRVSNSVQKTGRKQTSRLTIHILFSLQLKTQLSPEPASLSCQLQSSTAPRRPSHAHLQTLPFFFMEGFSESLPLIFLWLKAPLGWSFWRQCSWCEPRGRGSSLPLTPAWWLSLTVLFRHTQCPTGQARGLHGPVSRKSRPGVETDTQGAVTAPRGVC